MVSKAPTGTASGGKVIRRARLRAGISQAELARRLATSQSLIARWEAGAVEPAFDNVVRAVRACGLEMEMRLTTYDRDHDRLVDENLALTPAERLRKMIRTRSQLDRLRGMAVDG